MRSGNAPTHLTIWAILASFLCEEMPRDEEAVVRWLTVIMILAAATSSAKADSYADMAQFAQSICGDIPEGSLTRTAIQGKVGASAGALAKIVSGGGAVSESRTKEIYKGIPFDKLPDKIPTVSMCKIELMKIIFPQKMAELCKDPFPPAAMHECEKGFATVCGTWLYDDGAFKATWENLTQWAIVKVEHPRDSEFILRRKDQQPGQDFSGDYVGNVLPTLQADGKCRIEGTVQWFSNGQPYGSGTWFATW